MMSSTVDILRFYQHPHNHVSKVKFMPSFLNTRYNLCCDLNFKNHINVQSIEIVYRGSETQLQLTDN